MSEVNKVIFAGVVLLDLSSDTINEDVIIDGYTGHDAAGNKVTGKLKIITVDDALDASSANPVQNAVITSALNDRYTKAEVDALIANAITAALGTNGNGYFWKSKKS